jgi:hypothetical protein
MPSQALADEVDITVDVLVQVGAVAGVGVGANEAAVIKTLLRCTVNGRSLAACSRGLVLERLPAEVQPLSACMASGVSLDECALAEATRRLPAGSVEMGQCLASGLAAADCGAQEILRRLPPEARAVAACISKRPDLGQCVHAAGGDAAAKEALALIEKLRADARSELEAASPGGHGAMRNLLEIADGLRRDDWIQVSIATGAELYKALAKAAIKVALPQAGLASFAIDPVIDYIVQARADVMQDFMRAVKAGNAEAVGSVVASAYLLTYTLPICGLPFIPSELHEATCGNLAKVLGAMSGAAGDAVGAIGDVLEAAGGLATDAVRVLTKDTNCPSPQAYFASHHAQCYPYGAYLALTAPPKRDELTRTLNLACRKSYDRCFYSGDFERLCSPSRDVFDRHTQQLGAALSKAARLYAGGFEGYVRQSKQEQHGSCPVGGARGHASRFLALCERALQAQFRLAPQSSAPAVCSPAQRVVPTRSVYRQACETALAKVDTEAIAYRACLDPPAEPSGCRSTGGLCGTVTVQCSHLPPATSYVIAGEMVSGTQEGPGWLVASYSVVNGPFPLRVCASNMAGRRCSPPFVVELGSTTAPECLSRPTPRLCPSGQIPCGIQCLGRGRTCHREM